MRCSRCKKEGLTKSDFYIRKDRNQLRTECKKCTNERLEENRRRFTNWKRKDKFIMNCY